EIRREHPLSPLDDLEGLLETVSRHGADLTRVDEVVRLATRVELCDLVPKPDLPQEPEGLLQAVGEILVQRPGLRGGAQPLDRSLRRVSARDRGGPRKGPDDRDAPVLPAQRPGC